MARVLIEEFFPASHWLLTTTFSEQYEALLPPTCQSAQWGPIAFATLLPLGVMGVAIGLAGFFALKVHPTYRKAFLSFACMNSTAMVCHCLCASDSPFKWFWTAMDVGFTCCSSLCLCLGALGRGQQQDKQQALDKLASCLCPAALVIAAAGNYWSFGGFRSFPWLNEALYIQTPLLAAALLFTKEVLQPGLTPQQRTAINLAAVSFFIVPCMTPLNPQLCRLPRALHFDVTHVLFLGCNLSFWYLLKYLRLQEAVGASKLAKKAA